MSKRFTDTNKWEKSWFRKLPPRLKCFWSYLCDRCDCAGVWEPDYDLASLYVGQPVSPDDLNILNADGERLRSLPDGKVFIVRFLEFQYGILNATCRPHQKIIGTLARHGLTHSPERVSNNLSDRDKEEDQDKDKDKEKEEDTEGELGSGEKGVRFAASCVLTYLNTAAGRTFRPVHGNIKFIVARLSEPGVTVEEIKRMIDRQVKLWRGTDMEKYLRPETLFNERKFASYYDDRNQPTQQAQARQRFGASSVKQTPGSTAVNGF